LHKFGNAAGQYILMSREKVLHGFSADAPFERTIDVGIEFFGGKPRTFVEREMQPKQAPRRVLKTIELTEEGRRQLLASDQVLECAMYVTCGRAELFPTQWCVRQSIIPVARPFG
jgi:hypothetical protein